METKELCIISDSDIPAGSGGINGEGYTYGQLRHQPIITEILQRITHPIARQMAEECNERNSRDGFTMYKVDGEYCFEGLRESGKTKCYAQIKRNVIFSSKTKCNKIKTHTKPRGRFETNIQTDLFLYTKLKCIQNSFQTVFNQHLNRA